MGIVRETYSFLYANLWRERDNEFFLGRKEFSKQYSSEKNLGQASGGSLSKAWPLEASFIRQKWASYIIIPQSTGNSVGKSVVMALKKKGKSWGCQSAVLLVVGLLQVYWAVHFYSCHKPCTKDTWKARCELPLERNLPNITDRTRWK